MFACTIYNPLIQYSQEVKTNCNLTLFDPDAIPSLFNLFNRDQDPLVS